MATLEYEGPASRTVEPQERATRPVIWWAIVGAGFFVWQIYGFVRWMASGPRPTPHGNDPIPTWHLLTVWTLTIATLAAVPFALYYWLYKPWSKAGRIQFDGLMLLALLTLYWQDGGVNWTANWFVYSSAFPGQHGSWYGDLPGWLAPNGTKFVEPVLWSATMYLTAYFAMIVVGSYLLRRAKQRWPSLSKCQIIALAMGVGIFLDTVLEPLVMVRLGVWTYPGAIEKMTIFYGHYYQFPIYEGIFAGAWFGAMVLFRYFRNDRGETIAERGVEDLRVGAKTKAWIRLLAMCGAMNTIAMAVYTVPIQFFVLQSDPWIPDIVNHRSWQTNELCGPGTGYACTGPGIPNPRPGSAHLDYEGRLIAPDGSIIGSDGKPVKSAGP